MDSRPVSQRATPTLPDEILVKTIKACIEPYSLEAYERVYGEHIMTDYMTDTFHNSVDNTPYLDLTTLIVEHLSPNRLLYLSGLPKVNNLKLVNKMFDHEATTAVLVKFDGHFKITHSKELPFNTITTEWRPHPRPPSTMSFTWLYPLITDIFFGRLDEVPILLPHLQANLMPSLRKITVHADSTFAYAISEETVLGGRYDDRVKNTVHKLGRSWEFPDGLREDLFALCNGEGRRIQLEFLHDIESRPIKVWGPGVPADWKAYSAYKKLSTWYRFTLEMTSPADYVIKKRERKNQD